MRTIIAVAALSFLLLTSSAGGQSSQTIVVPTDGSVHHAGPFPGTIGNSYMLQVFGTFHIGGPGDQMGDAEYADFSNPPASLQDFSGLVDLGVTVNGVKLRWGPYASNHVYETPYTPTTSTFDISYLDSDYTDNSGVIFLNVTVPEPSAILLSMAATLALIGLRRNRRGILEACRGSHFPFH